MGDIAIDLVTRSERKSIYFDNLCFSVSKPERIDILKNLRGYFNAGRLSAIIGPSGAGKSTFLNILSGFKKPSNESILLINGERVSQSFIRKNSAYIAQDTTFLGKLTTKETLEYAAKFKLPTNTSISERSTIIDDIVKVLGLEKCLANHVEKLSGGEWKRLAIGEELITNPPVMIFDEPTSGLDSVSTIQVVKHLKDLAQSGRTIICVIHQLSSLVLEYFDDVYVLSNGQCIYNGSVEDIVPRFQEAGFYCPQYYNRADFILDVASGQRQGNLELLLSKARENIQMQDMIEKCFHSINTSTNEVTPVGSKDDLQLIESSFPVTQWDQFCILLSRAFLCNRRELILAQLKFVISLLCGIFFGLTYYNIGDDASKVLSNISLLLLLLLLVFFGTSVPIILLYPSESKTFHREYLNNRYAFLPYFYAKIVADLPIVFVCTYATFLPAYFLSSQPDDVPKVLYISLIFLLLAINSLFCGLTIGVVFGVKMGIFILPVTSIAKIAYSGYLIRYREIPIYLKPLTYFSFMRYYFEGIMQIIYGFDRKELSCERLLCLLKSPERILDEVDMAEPNYALDIVGIIVWIAIFKLVSMFALKRQLKNLLK